MEFKGKCENYDQFFHHHYPELEMVQRAIKEFTVKKNFLNGKTIIEHNRVKMYKKAQDELTEEDYYGDEPFWKPISGYCIKLKEDKQC